MDIFQSLLGLNSEPRNLTLLQVTLRAVIVFIAALIMVRTGAKRFLGRKTAFDFILLFILGSMLSRAINGSAPFFPTLAGGAVLVWFHRALSALSFRFHKFGKLVKGADDIIIENGKVCAEALKKNYLTQNDLLEDLRLKSYESPADIKSARIERSGDLSVISKDESEESGQPEQGSKAGL